MEEVREDKEKLGPGEIRGYEMAVSICSVGLVRSMVAKKNPHTRLILLVSIFTMICRWESLLLLLVVLNFLNALSSLKLGWCSWFLLLLQCIHHAYLLRKSFLFHRSYIFFWMTPVWRECELERPAKKWDTNLLLDLTELLCNAFWLVVLR